MVTLAGKELQTQAFSVLLQPGPAGPVGLQTGRCEHAPTHLRGFGPASELIFDHDPVVRLQREAAGGAGELASIRSRSISTTA